MPRLVLSVVIPAYNEERRLPKTIERIHAYLMKNFIPGEVIVIDDGSTDGTAKLVMGCAERFPEVRLVSNGRNRGKGYSVRHGMMEAGGEIALFTDADLSAPIEEADKLVAYLRGGDYDGAIGSRAMNRRLIEVHQSWLREVAGILFNRVVRFIAGVSFADTQCGFKAFRRERADIIFQQQRTEGFGFDAEILFLARRHGLRVAEVPVRWAHDPATKVHVVRDSIRMLWDLISIRWNLLVGRYPREKARLPVPSF